MTFRFGSGSDVQDLDERFSTTRPRKQRCIAAVSPFHIGISSKQQREIRIFRYSMPSASSSSSSFSANVRVVEDSSSGNIASDCNKRSRSVTVDLVSAARNSLAFLSVISESTWLQHRPTLLRSIRRYHHFWMPLISRLSSSSSAEVGASCSSLLLLPPLDVQWIWHCHCLRHEKYKEYCLLRFGVMVERPAIFDDENEEYAYNRCHQIWKENYPSEPFYLTENADESCDGEGGDELFEIVDTYKDLCGNYSDLFVFERVFLVSARLRYLRFLQLCEKLIKSGCDRGGFRLVPTSDILLMWQTHKSFAKKYETDMRGLGFGDLKRYAVEYGDSVRDGEAKETRRVWEEEFNEPYEKAGTNLRLAVSHSRVLSCWKSSDVDVNRRYKVLRPRCMLLVLVFLKGKLNFSTTAMDYKKTSLRLQMLRCHREMKLDKPLTSLSSQSWQESWHLYCEFGTQGLMLLLRKRSTGCLQRNKVLKELVFEWNELLRVPMLSLTKDLEVQMGVLVSITPPVQAPYLLRCVPDRVTDDNGAMISDVILRMNSYHPQRGRWLSRTVIDHSRRECFVIRIRIAEGFWRKGAETPRAVGWENRVIEVHEGPWTYIAGSQFDGKAPKKLVGVGTPKEKNAQESKITWSLSTGDSLTIEWRNGLEIQLENESSTEPMKLLKGRKLQYQVNGSSENIEFENEEENFFTLVRFSPENPIGKATALINWRLFAVEFLPEEDAVFVLLVCTIIIRTISEITKKDVGRLLLRRRVNERKSGIRDWGSVVLPSSSSPYLNRWFWNAAEVLASAEVNDTRQPSHWYSPADGKEEMYKEAILT